MYSLACMLPLFMPRMHVHGAGESFGRGPGGGGGLVGMVHARHDPMERDQAGARRPAEG